MKRLLFFLMLLMPVGLTYAQEQELLPPPIFVPNPPIRFTIQDVLSVIADYDVKHIDVPPTMVRWYGATDYQYNFCIYLFRGDTYTRRTTLIHEIVHVLYQQKGLTVPEEQIMADEAILYLQLFGQP